MSKAKEKDIPRLREEARSRNDHTGDRIVTKHRGQSKYAENFDKIVWNTRERKD